MPEEGIIYPVTEVTDKLQAAMWTQGLKVGVSGGAVIAPTL